MVYQIALCEDDKIFADNLELNCKCILEKLNLAYCLSIYQNSSNFLDDIAKNNVCFDLLLLDIIMEGRNGIEIAQVVRQTGSKATIIFVSSTAHYAIQGYDVGALHYLVKPVNYNLLEQLIAADYYHRFKTEFYIFKVGIQKIRLSLSEIIYLETVGRRVAVNFKDQTIYHTGKLCELLLDFPCNMFVRCHQGFAVNVSCIRELSRQKVILTNGNTLPVSRTFAKDVQKAFAHQLRAR